MDLFTRATLWVASVLIVIWLIVIELIVEVTGLISSTIHHPEPDLMEEDGKDVTILL